MSEFAAIWIHFGSRASCSERLCPVHEVHHTCGDRLGAMSSKSLHAGPSRKQMSKRISSSSSTPSLPPLSIPMKQIYSRRWTSEAKRYLHVHKQQRCSGKNGVLFCWLWKLFQSQNQNLGMIRAIPATQITQSPPSHTGTVSSRSPELSVAMYQSSTCPEASCG